MLDSHKSAFTLVELLIAIGIFGIISVVISDSYIRDMRHDSSTNLSRQTYDDARFIMEMITREVADGMIDYDEYYNRNVIRKQREYGDSEKENTYGQNFGAYYSSFYNPGSDNILGFDCSDGVEHSRRGCNPIRGTLDRNTGQNPFKGKMQRPFAFQENAFCGFNTRDASGQPVNQNVGLCHDDGNPNTSGEMHHEELYLISQDSSQKTILAKERVGQNTYALSILRLKGYDTDSDGVYDAFICGDDFQCRGTLDVDGVSGLTHGNGNCGGAAATPAEVPRPPAVELEEFRSDDLCENFNSGFNKDFVPISPLRVTVKELKFYITPTEDPIYAFSEEEEQKQPGVTIVLTVEVSPDYSPEVDFDPVTFVSTVNAGARSPIIAPVKVEE